MDVGIMTFALSDNYGALLQTYATAKAIETLGATPVVYKYNDNRRINASMCTSAKIKHMVWKSVKNIFLFGIKKRKFNMFRKFYIPMTSKCYHNNSELKKEPGNYDLYIAGSDQIWNPDVFLYDKSYFLDFVPEGKRKISYASSFGKAVFNCKNVEDYANLLGKFECLSVRESSGVNIIKEVCNKNATVVLDPTMLLDKTEWRKLALYGKKRARNFNGILCYVMPGDKEVTEAIEYVAQQLHKKTGLPIMRLGLKEYEVLKHGYKQCDIWAGPLDFVSYFNNAEYVVTNSFHGTAFSLVFEKKFYVIINDNLKKEQSLQERVLSILDKVNANEAIITTSQKDVSEKAILDYATISSKLDEERQKSFDYLKDAFEGERVVVDKKKCFGCSACYAICSKRAIRMVENKEGFIEPQIVSDMCVDCGLCKQICPAVHPYEKTRTRNKAVALQHKEEKIREKSTSGAAFVALSDVILHQNGVVYGVIYNDNMVATHIRTTERKERDLMCGSKYSQSEIGDIFDCVLKDLKNRKKVFFVGTSCQIDGLTHFLKQKRCDMSKLITCDLICHGVPSPLIWKEHIKHIEKVRGKKVVAYFNRSKIKGWHAHNECVCYENGKQEWRTKLSQNFKDLFYGHYIIRMACQTCPYAGEPGVSDLTIGDFWGCEDIFPDKDDNKGTSILIINSTKGEKVFEECKEQINWWDVPIDLALKYNHNKPIKHHPNREKFWDDYSFMGYAGVVKKYAGDTVKGRIKYYVKKWLRSILVRLKILHA